MKMKIIVLLLLIQIIIVGIVQSKPNIIEFGEDSYNLGETVVIFLKAIPNPQGTNTVDGFLVNIQYGDETTMDYVEDYDSKYIEAKNNQATISFRASKGDNYITVESWAFDAPEDSGGIPSEKSVSQIWIFDSVSETNIDNIEDKNSTPAFEFIYLIIIILSLIVLRKAKSKNLF